MPDEGDDDIYTKINKNMDIFGRIYKEIALNYVDEINPDKFMQAGIEGMLSTLDPYTNFIDESRKDEVDMLTTGKYGGVGISIGIKDSQFVVTDLLDGYSAQKEGIKRGDKLFEIDGNIVQGKRMVEIRAMIRGEAGTKVKVKIKRGENEIEFSLTRQEIKLKNVTYKGMLEDGIGYIKLERFNKYAENEVLDALTELKSKGELRGIVFDLRDNPGGLLDAAVGILNKFVDRGSLLLTTKGRKQDSERKYFSTQEPVIDKNIPLILLVNEGSASASEIVAGAIQDLDRGVILGTKTFGKGLVQVFTPLSYGNQLKITNQKYFTPSGRWIQLKNYFKENKYGVFAPNPYFNQIEFKTLDGRIVYAEGGITPDTTVVFTMNNDLLIALNEQDMYYKFAEQFVQQNPDANSFSMNDNFAQSFYDFVNSENFQFKSTVDKEILKLKNYLSDNQYSEKTKQLASELESSLSTERFKDFETSRSTIKRILEIEILKKYGKADEVIIQSSLKDDTQVNTAVSLIKDKAVYRSLLSPR